MHTTVTVADPVPFLPDLDPGSWILLRYVFINIMAFACLILTSNDTYNSKAVNIAETVF